MLEAPKKVQETMVSPCGVNLGGWVSQSDLSAEHIENFITLKDIWDIRSFGFTGVRVPVDAAFLWADRGVGKLEEQKWRWLKGWLEKMSAEGLHIVLDIHETPWHSFGRPDEALLWSRPEALEAFAEHLAELTFLLKGFESHRLWIDILNEPTAPQAAKWHEAARRLRDAVRSEDASRVVVVESNRWGHIAELFGLVEALDADGVVFSFHFYEPLLFTHQGAPWCREVQGETRPIVYPGPVPEPPRDVSACLALEALQPWRQKGLNRSFLEDLLEPARRLAQKGVPLYCGEFGAYEKCPRRSRLAWISDVVDLFSDLKIGWAYWNYKWMDFGLLPKTPEGGTGPLDREILEILRKGVSAA